MSVFALDCVLSCSPSIFVVLFYLSFKVLPLKFVLFNRYDMNNIKTID